MGSMQDASASTVHFPRLCATLEPPLEKCAPCGRNPSSLSFPPLPNASKYTSVGFCTTPCHGQLQVTVRC